MRSSLRPLPPDAGKEARGRVLIVGGSQRYPGAMLLAYHIADKRGNDVDQPRNLAKAVTVE